jgi:NAD(P)-dependent dehydrogenase (short-subunit alcohol dehydrogenase family)
MDAPLTGRFALITGASRGLGRELARAYVKAGASVWLIARSFPDLLQAKTELTPLLKPGQMVNCSPCDLNNAGAAEGIFKDVCKAWPDWDVLVNNAGIQGPIGPAWENDPKAWEQTVRVNLLVPVELSRLAAPVLGKKSRGKIINLSGGGATTARPNFSAYASAKAALVRFSETLAEEARAVNVDVNTVAPGAMNTEMTRAIVAAGAKAGPELQKAAKQLEDPSATPERAANLCVFLASKQSDGITGKLISAIWDPWERMESLKSELEKSDVYTLRRIAPEDRGLNWK